MAGVEVLSEHRVHGGRLAYVRAVSAAVRGPMRFTVFTPPGEGPFPAVVWLSGLTCTEENFTTKAGAYRTAARLGLVVAAPDTSPRGPGVADDPAPDLGQGAGFYVDATQPPWSAHFRMESFICEDLPVAIREAAPVRPGKMGLFGHSMGGHGALSLALKRPDLFASVSAFAPIATTLGCAWGEKALCAYLGPDRQAWRRADVCSLLEEGAGRGAFDEILVDQGLSDPFLESQLRPERLEAAAVAAGQSLTLRRHAGYDHSYFFIQTFIGDHLAFHAARFA